MFWIRCESCVRWKWNEILCVGCRFKGNDFRESFAEFSAKGNRYFYISECEYIFIWLLDLYMFDSINKLICKYMFFFVEFVLIWNNIQFWILGIFKIELSMSLEKPWMRLQYTIFWENHARTNPNKFPTGQIQNRRFKDQPFRQELPWIFHEFVYNGRVLLCAVTLRKARESAPL